MKSVKFHENGKTYFWVIAQATVYNAFDEIVATECYNLDQARAAVRGAR